MIIIGFVISSATTLASLNDSVTVGPNTITAIQDDKGNCDDNVSNIDISFNGSNSNNVDINVDTDQSSTTGYVSNSGNNGTDVATSGDANNCNSTEMDINFQN